MGLEGISPWQLLILLAIVLAIFGTKKLRNVGGDLGAAMRDFRGAMGGNEDKAQDKADPESESGNGDRVLDQQEVASPTAQHKQHDNQTNSQ